MDVEVISFGYRHGVPSGVARAWDVRDLPNPYPRHLGQGPQWVIAHGGDQVAAEVVAWLQWKSEEVGAQGRQITIGIGCHGGRHRSVAIADEVGRLVPGCKVTHRELGRCP